MARKPRDYKAEYAKRVERGLKRGYSKARARGHRPATRTSNRPVTDDDLRSKLERAYDVFKKSKNLSQSAKAAGVTAERFRNYLRANRLVRKRGRRWSLLPDSRIRELEMFTTRGWKVVAVRGFASASDIGEHRAAVKFYKDTGNVEQLGKFIGRTLEDIHGHPHIFETRLNLILRQFKTGRGSFEQVYRIVSN